MGNGQPPRRHTDRKIAPLGVAGRNLSGQADYRFALYDYYRSRGVPMRSILPQIGYGVGLIDDAVRHTRTESVADRGAVRMKAVRIAILLARFWQIGSLVRLDSFPPFRVIARLSA